MSFKNLLARMRVKVVEPVALEPRDETGMPDDGAKTRIDNIQPREPISPATEFSRQGPCALKPSVHVGLVVGEFLSAVEADAARDEVGVCRAATG